MDSSNPPLKVWLNGKELSFDISIDEKEFVIENNLKFNVQIMRGGYDPSRLSIVLGSEGILSGFEISLWEEAENNILVSSDTSTDEIIGQRLFGECSIDICYNGKPIYGYSTLVNFIPNDTVITKVNFIRSSLESANSIILDLYGLARDKFVFSQKHSSTENSVSQEKFLLLNQFYLQSESFFLLQAEQLDFVLTRNKGHMIPISKGHPITVNKIIESYQSGEPLRNMQHICFNQNSNNLSCAVKFLPARIPSYIPTMSFDTGPNRISLKILKYMFLEAKHIYGYLIDELKTISQNKIRHGGYAIYIQFKKDRLQKSIQKCKQIIESILNKINLLIWLGVKPKDIYEYPQKVWINPYYRSLLSSFELYNKKNLALPSLIQTDELNYPLQTRSINNLYEIWVVHIILKVLIEKLGFIPKEDTYTKYKNVFCNYILKGGTTLELASPIGEHVIFNYDKIYPSFDDVHCEENVGSVSRKYVGGQRRVQKDNPDLSLEFYQSFNSEPKILIFDATFSNNPDIHQNKLQYLNTIWYRPQPDSPRSEWHQPVKEVIVIHPYPAEDELSKRFEFDLVPEEGVEEKTTIYLKNLLKQYSLI